MKDDGVGHLKDVVREIDCAQVLENYVLDKRVLVPELAVRVGRHHLIELGHDELVRHARDRIAAGVQVLEEGRVLKELEAGLANGVDDSVR